jgi:hypothetical protein
MKKSKTTNASTSGAKGKKKQELGQGASKVKVGYVLAFYPVKSLATNLADQVLRNPHA